VDVGVCAPDRPSQREAGVFGTKTEYLDRLAEDVMLAILRART
jgi:hypothetical protein